MTPIVAMSPFPPRWASGTSSSTTTKIIAPAAKARVYGRIGPAEMTKAAPNTAATGSTIAETCPHRKLPLRERPSRRSGRDTAAPSGKF